MSETPDAEPTLEELLTAVDAARDRVRHAEPAAQEVANSLLEATDAFTKHALVTLVRTLRADEQGKQLLVKATQQPDVAALFAVHGIIRGSREREVLAVLEALRPHLAKAGASATLDKLDGDVAVLKFSGNASGHSGDEMQHGIEQALREHVPWLTGVRAAAEPTLIGTSTLSMPKPWVDGPLVSEVPTDRTVFVKTDEVGVIVLRVGDEVRAYKNQCAHQGLPLDKAMLDGGELQCIWHGYRYEALTGSGVTDPGCELEPVDVRVVDGRVQVRA